MFLLVISMLAQSLTTLGCELEQLSYFAGPDSASLQMGLPDVPSFVALSIDADGTTPGICTRCGGLITATGCCAHGIPMVVVALKFPVPSATSQLVAAGISGIAQYTPSDLFRPPILA
jgi:hypothetical protein